MKFVVTTNAVGSWIIEATEPSRWDGRPNNTRLILDSVPQIVDSNRLAVAITLLFGRHCAGYVDFPSPVNVVTAAAISDFLSPGRIYFSKVDEGPKPIPSGHATLKVQNSVPWEAAQVQTDRSLVLLARSDYRGSLYWPRGIAVSTNAILFDSAYFPWGQLAASVLFASDMEAGTIALDSIPRLDQQRWAVVSNLLSSTGLSLDFVQDE